MRRALYGGTYDPLHYGHLRVAEEVREALGLDRVLFMPANVNPLKTDIESSSPEDRVEIVRRAIDGNPAFDLSELEVGRGGPSYTVETLKALTGEEGEGALYLVVGSDSFNEIRSWCAYEEIFRLANMVVVPRLGHQPKKPGEALPESLARAFSYNREDGSYSTGFGTTLHYLDTTIIDISSTEIRRMVAGGRSIKYLVPPSVEEYIEERGLYRPAE